MVFEELEPTRATNNSRYPGGRYKSDNLIYGDKGVEVGRGGGVRGVEKTRWGGGKIRPPWPYLLDLGGGGCNQEVWGFNPPNPSSIRPLLISYMHTGVYSAKVRVNPELIIGLQVYGSRYMHYAEI